jgi:hypothetical protein
MGLFIFILLGTVLTLFYGAMAGFTIQIARRAGMSEGPDIACGLAWPVGLGIALSYGSSHGLSTTPAERRTIQQVSAVEQRANALEQQKHETQMAELKAREAIALERAVNPTYRAVEDGSDPEPKALEAREQRKHASGGYISGWEKPRW